MTTRVLVMAALLCAAGNVAALTIGTSGVLQWGYPVEEEVRTDEFILYCNDEPAGTAQPQARELDILSLSLSSGQYSCYLVATNAEGESDPSNSVGFFYVTDRPNSPTGVVIITR